MKHNKACGSVNLVAEMFSLLDWPALETIRFAFESRLINAVPGFCDSAHEWDKILVQCVPKCLAAHLVSLWRPIALVSAFAK
eukprot:131930-Heterocapsa_arctica.AAC.1